MDLIHSDNNLEGNDEKSVVPLLSPCSNDSDWGDIFGDPEILPRIGDQYQAKIPPLVIDYDRLVKKSIDVEVNIDIPQHLLFSLPIPIMWAHVNFDHSKQEAVGVLCNKADATNIDGRVEYENSQITSNVGDSNIGNANIVESSDTALNDEKERGELSNLELGGDKMDAVLTQNKKAQLDSRSKGCCPFPGSLGDSWSEFECESFLLGLYIFGKNMLLVKKLVGSKEMGDVLSFYYGKFYRSEGYRRWSECRKVRSRRCIHGQRIFSGGRLQELLSRLFRDVSEECQNKLLEVSRTFEEGKLSLEEYVFCLKNLVGLNKLIDAVGIGKGKQDLTGTAAEPIKTNHVLSVRPEIPVGKACSSLSREDIIKFLTGDFRLSKARSSDLFWEAVWPRLLARGWHSEQPKDHGVSGLKHNLVFLIPGIKKFSRRKLVKGEHYFDSVSDVLNKVASDPGLLELETEAAKGSKDEEDWRNLKINQNPDGFSKGQCHHYLKPHNSKSSQDSMKFTIVDTSLYDGEDRSKIRVLRRLPVATEIVFNPTGLSNDTEQDSSEDSEDEGIHTSNLMEDATNGGACGDSSECVTSILNNGMPMTPNLVAVENHEGQSAAAYNDERSGQSNELAPFTRLQSTASGLEESSQSFENISIDIMLKDENLHCRSDSPNAHETMVCQLGPAQHVSSASSSAKGSPEDRNNSNFFDNCPGTETCSEKHQPDSSIDLNVPHAPPDIGISESVSMDMEHKREDLHANKLSLQSETSEQPKPLIHSGEGATIQLQPVMNGRRQSTRNRPLTTKALEAIESGFLNTKRKRKCVEALPQTNKSMSRSSRSSKKLGVSSTVDSGVANSIADSRMENAELGGIF